MTKKMKKDSGFTLVEMLIVVAIIAILIAVSIPLVSSSLEKAREAADAANERAFKAVLTIQYLSEDFDKDEIYAYDAINGKAVAVADKPNNAYGQGTNTMGVTSEDNTDKILYGYIKTGGDVVIGWESATGNPTTDTIDTASEKLTSLEMAKKST